MSVTTLVSLMADQTTPTGEAEPEERMVQRDQQTRERVARAEENDREHDYEGEATTEPFDVSDALKRL